ncbi:MAG: hypothetical protein DRP62_01580 [Planctomycetota bacterium]|nr:MAG: hypothetical protein DRP62_01580 [Planctomycetota bacterium]
MNLKVNPERYKKYGDRSITGFFVRARHGNKWVSTDIINLTEDSLKEWFNSYSKDGVVYIVIKLVDVIDEIFNYIKP